MDEWGDLQAVSLCNLVQNEVSAQQHEVGYLVTLCCEPSLHKLQYYSAQPTTGK